MNQMELLIRRRIAEIRLAAAASIALVWFGPLAGLTQGELMADDGRGVLRLDPYQDTLVAVPTDELRVGYVYSHFSERLRRRVWSFYQGDGRFWYALGEGTRQPARRLDVPANNDESVDKTEESVADLPKLAREYTVHEGDIFVRLRADNRWEFAGRVGVPNIYNAETGRRWEKQSDVYIPISHGGGYHWRVKSDKYVPNLSAQGVARCTGPRVQTIP